MAWSCLRWPVQPRAEGVQQLRSAWRLWHALLLAVLLLAAQAAGLAHRLAHGGPVSGLSGLAGLPGLSDLPGLPGRVAALGHRLSHGHGQAIAEEGAAAAAAIGVVVQTVAMAPDDAHGHAPGAAECRLVDQLLAPAGLLLAAADAAPPAAAALAPATRGLPAGGLASAAAYQARAPPRG